MTCKTEKHRTMPAATPPQFLASACLCGIACRYNGTSATIERLEKLYAAGCVLPVCPEEAGGLPTPRPPCERVHDRILTSTGTDVTEQFQKGAAYTLHLARQHDIRLAILKENSPSCGSGMIYDGTFSGRRISGQGITAALLRQHAIRVVNEETFLSMEINIR